MDAAVQRERAQRFRALHRAAHLTSHNGAVWRRLVRLQKAGVIGHLGVSVQTPEEAFQALAMRGEEALIAAIKAFKPVVHPVVRVNPDSKRKCIFVNSDFTRHI